VPSPTCEADTFSLLHALLCIDDGELLMEHNSEAGGTGVERDGTRRTVTRGWGQNDLETFASQ
jgi:hypothetical protein